ncbi:MAG TPA: 2-iminoacetate synthase ThiH [Candidatus Omnitrophota bacterium]|nr:2-iminoacetate synthase ThiH [Candidatus Omnitrophota bacterium]
MTFYNTLQESEACLRSFDAHEISRGSVIRAVESEARSPERLLTLLSPQASDDLELMARKAHEITLRQFGRVIQLYTPLYLSNFCDNQCSYCGFNARNRVPRKTLTLEEIEREAAYIASTGLKHILILTGGSRAHAPLSYIKSAVRVLKKYFSSISAEIYALSEGEYAELATEGVDGLTIYQETYHEAVYDRVHKAGPKKDFQFRLEAPERAARGAFRNVNIGALLGLSDWRRESFFLGMHAGYLQDRFPNVEISASVPRIRPHEGDFSGFEQVSDRDLVQMILALRLFLPRLGITLSTRESPWLRENLVPLGVTRMSAGSTTEVGGHTVACHDAEDASQFKIADERNVEEIKAMLVARGYQPVLKDWMRL